MEAAAHGHSTLNIPKKVGEEFVRADDAEPGHAAGMVLVAPDGAILLLLRSSGEANYAGHWALPGGGGEPGELPLATVLREAGEEMGSAILHTFLGEPTLADQTTTPTGMQFYTYLQPVRYRLPPELNAEHSGFAWVEPSALPSPIHPGVARVLGMLFATEVNLAGDEAIATDEASFPQEWDVVPLAHDEASVRSRDADGRLHVEVTPISKANVCGYYGREIPNHVALGLDPDRKYRLLRDPEELARAVDSFNHLPLLRRHVPVSARSHRPEDVVGSTGTDAAWSPPFLTNSIVVWSQDDIDQIEAEEKKELSSAYRYRADMTPGEYEGEPYDGVMRDIVGNHVALVREGRAGPDVVVGDEMPAGMVTEPNSGVPAMADKDRAEDEWSDEARTKAAEARKGSGGGEAGNRQGLSKNDSNALSSLVDLHKSGKISKEQLHDSVRVVTGKDGDTMAKAKDEKDDAPEKKPAMDAAEGLKESLKDKFAGDEEGYKAACDSIDDMMKAKKDDDKAEDEEKEDDRPDPEGTNDKAKDEKDEDEKDEKKAMDEAIESRVSAAVTKERTRQAGVREAERTVRPIIGEVTIAMDAQPEDVYALALKAKGVDIKGVHPSAYRSMVGMLPKAARTPTPQGGSVMAMDGAGGKSFAERYPEAASVKLNG